MTFQLSRIALPVLAGISLATIALAAGEPGQSDAGGLTDKEKKALGRLHHQAVEVFVDRPGFGVRRLEMNLDDLLYRPKVISKADKPLKISTKHPGDKPAHFAVKDLLVKWVGRFPTEDGKGMWQVRDIHLVGLVKYAEPVVYLVDGNPKDRNGKPKDPKEIPTRALDPFEEEALQAIRGGEQGKAVKRSQEMRLLAPIYAGKRCAACHQEGILLGGFTYELERVTRDLKGEEPNLPGTDTKSGSR